MEFDNGERRTYTSEQLREEFSFADIQPARAVEFNSGEMHTYTSEQLREKFGFTDIQPRTAVAHSDRHRGTVAKNKMAKEAGEEHDGFLEQLVAAVHGNGKRQVHLRLQRSVLGGNKHDKFC